MKKRGILSVLLAVLMIVSMLPSMVFAETTVSGELSGKLKIQGLAAVGVKLGADYSKVQPTGVTDDHVTFSWSRKDGETLTELSTEKNYTVAEEDLGYQLELKVTGIQELGVTGSLTVLSNPVTATEQEAADLVAAQPDEDAADVTVPDAGTGNAGENAEGTEGDGIIIEGDGTFAEGDGTYVEGDGTYTEGDGTFVEGDGTYVEGDGTYTEGDGTYVEGDDTYIEGDGTYVEGDDTYIEGDGTNTEGGPDVYVEEVPFVDPNEQPDASGDISGEETYVEEIPEGEEFVETETPAEGEPEESGEGQESAGVYAAQVETENGTDVLDFGTVEAGNEEAETQYVTVTNTGTEELNFEPVSPENFMVQDIGTLQAGESATLWIQPRAGIAEGSYDDVITYPSVEGTTVSVRATAQILNAPGSEASISALKESLDFGTLTEGYDVNTLTAQDVTLTNDGTEEVTVSMPQGTNFSVSETADVTIGAGDSVTFTVVPVSGLTEGTYTENLTFAVQGSDASVMVTAFVNIEKGGATDPQAGNALSLSVPELTFEEREAGYADVPAAQDITVTNSGSSDLTVSASLADGSAFSVTPDSAMVSANGGTAVFSVQPNVGLNAGDYADILTVGTSDGVESASAKLSFNVKDAAPAAEELLNIQWPADITGLDNGTEKSAAAFGLPENLVIETSTGATPSAPVTWDVENCTYDPSSKEEQIFEVKGTVALPANVENTNGVDLEGTISVTVNAAPQETEKLVSIQTVADITGLANGTAKTAEALKLPATVVVTTTKGQKEAAIAWDLDNCSYDPDSKEAQTFQVSGTVTLPDGVSNPDGVDPVVTVNVSVSKAEVKLTGIVNPDSIAGLANGSAKTADGLELPSSVTINTTDGDKMAPVTWKVNECAYNPDSKEAQTFQVAGTVTLPDGVTNPDNIGLSVLISVSVNEAAAEYVPKIPDSSKTYITGISSDGDYTTETKITFTAVGGGMDNKNPGKGDIRYVPASWKVLESRNWDGEPYTATFRMNKGGDYTLTVAFNEQKYDGTQWVKTGGQATRQVSFHVKQVATVTATPTPTPVPMRKAVRTGDATVILPFVIILVIAAVCIGGILVYRKKKK